VPFNQTCSVGIATWDGEEPGYELVHRADQAMYAAKVAGGGRVDGGPVTA
jgi:GGDEF domain-containing protein